MPVVGSQPADTALASPTADVINGVYNELLVVQLQATMRAGSETI